MYEQATVRALSTDIIRCLLHRANEVLHNPLRNPQTNENHLLALLKRRDLSENLLKQISRLESVKSI